MEGKRGVNEWEGKWKRREKGKWKGKGRVKDWEW
jgi:hypothetical protein